MRCTATTCQSFPVLTRAGGPGAAAAYGPAAAASRGVQHRSCPGRAGGIPSPHRSLRTPPVSSLAQPATAPAVPRDRVYVIFSGLILAMLLAALDSTIVATALPTIVGELGGLEHLSWVVTAYLLAQTVVTPLYGKLGDLYGRKGVLQSGIVIFLIGSALCGLSQSMLQLILFRAIQGLGGGGLTVTTQAVVGDIVPPRERGRYQGIFGAVFGLSSIAGPLLGGYFTTHLSWRWIFYVNLPLGILALVVLAATLPSRGERVGHAIDYAGATLLAVTLSAVILVTDLGGSAYAWTDPLVLSLIAAAVLGLVLFLVVERRAREPVLPLRLFANRSFAVSTTVGFIVGFALFGSVTYLPLFLQVVQGASPTGSGLQMLPMMGGMLLTSITSGQLISRTGRYRWFPIVGTAVMSVGLYLLSRMTVDTSLLAASIYMLVLGLGLGMVMQVLIIAVQNEVAYGDLGVATSGATLFRLIGGSVGTAVLGAIFAGRLSTQLQRLLPSGGGEAGAAAGAGFTPAALANLSPALRAIYAQAFTLSLGTVFLVATAVGALGFVVAWLLPERPLRETISATVGEGAGEVGEGFGMPTDRDAKSRILQGLRVLADRDVQREYIQQIVSRAGVTLTPLAAWLLVRIEREEHYDTQGVAREHDLDPALLRAAVDELRSTGMIVERGVTPERRELVLTTEGCDVMNRLVAARRERLAELFGEWNPERHEEVAAVLRRIVSELLPEQAIEGGRA